MSDNGIVGVPGSTHVVHNIVTSPSREGVLRDNQDRRAALIAAASYCANSDVFSSRDVTEIAEKFLTWLEGT